MFEGFTRGVANVGGTDIAYVTAGSGPPLLLLHGFPQCKAMWARVAPQLTDQLHRRVRGPAGLWRFGRSRRVCLTGPTTPSGPWPRIRLR